MIKRDDAISIKELVKRANSNRTRVYKNIVKGWQEDPVKKDFIFQVEAPGTKTGYAWMIKNPAIQLAIKTLSILSPAEQGTKPREQEQGTRIKQEITRMNKGEQEQGNQELNKVDILFVNFLKEQVTRKDSMIEKLQTQLDDREKSWRDQFDFLKRLLPAPKLAGDTPDAAELATDRNVEQQRANEADTVPLATAISSPVEKPSESTPGSQPEPQPELLAETASEPFTESDEQEVGKQQLPVNQGSTASEISPDVPDNTCTQGQENNFSL